MLILIATPVLAQPRAFEETLSPELDGCLGRALAYLARQQQTDGSFQNREQGGQGTPNFSGPKVPLTAMSVLCFLSAGRMPDVGRHGLAVRNGIDYLARTCPEDGFFGSIDRCGMEGHALATLALAEAIGNEADEKRRKPVRAGLERAVKALLAAQNVKKDAKLAGGWGEDVASADSQLLITARCVVALRAAHSAGVDVPRAVIERAAAFVLKCWDAQASGFAQRPSEQPATAATAAGILALIMLDRPWRPEIRKAAPWLTDYRAKPSESGWLNTRYLVTAAAFQMGGENWPKVWAGSQGALLPLQQKDGAIPAAASDDHKGQTYSTAVATLTLTIPLRLLPSNQR